MGSAAFPTRLTDRAPGALMSNRFPFPLPTGWFQVSYSDELAPGEVKPLRYFAQDLVLFRTESGEAHLLDAFCPHLGAHLGHGGVVQGDSIVCPFHAWEFNGQGKCTKVPYAGKIPKKSTLKQWDIVERNGLIMAWYDDDGRPPSWEVPELPEIGQEDWTPYTKRNWTVKSCNQEMAENAVDSAHFLYLHGTAGQPETTATLDEHVMHAVSETKMTVYGNIVAGRIDVHCYGFGFTTTRFTGLAETLLVSSNTPIDHDHVELRFAFTVKQMGGMTPMISDKFVNEIRRQVEQDIPIWENKVYLNRPALCDGDGPVGLFRTWARQFYPPKAEADA